MTQGSINLFTLYRDTFSRVVCNVFRSNVCILIEIELFTSLALHCISGKVLARTRYGEKYIITTYEIEAEVCY